MLLNLGQVSFPFWSLGFPFCKMRTEWEATERPHLGFGRFPSPGYFTDRLLVGSAGG